MLWGTVTAVDGYRIEITFPKQLKVLFDAHLANRGHIDYRVVIAQTSMDVRLYAGSSVAQGTTNNGQLYAVTHKFI